jgi:hypothetical protein
MLTEIKGNQFGVRFEKRGPKDPHVIIQLLSEDDDNWFEVGNSFSAFWISDLIAVLETAQETLKNNAKWNRKEFGYEFK